MSAPGKLCYHCSRCFWLTSTYGIDDFPYPTKPAEPEPTIGIRDIMPGNTRGLPRDLTKPEYVAKLESSWMVKERWAIFDNEPKDDDWQSQTNKLDDWVLFWGRSSYQLAENPGFTSPAPRIRLKSAGLRWVLPNISSTRARQGRRLLSSSVILSILYYYHVIRWTGWLRPNRNKLVIITIMIFATAFP